MKVTLTGKTVIGVMLFVIVAVITALVVAFGLAIAYALTLIVRDLDLRQALTSGAVFSGFSLYFCFRFFAYTIIERDLPYRCDECAEKVEDDIQHATPVQPPFVLRTVRTRRPKTKQAPNKRGPGTGDKP